MRLWLTSYSSRKNEVNNDKFSNKTINIFMNLYFRICPLIFFDVTKALENLEIYFKIYVVRHNRLAGLCIIACRTL